jgi:hypothetical protein
MINRFYMTGPELYKMVLVFIRLSFHLTGMDDEDNDSLPLNEMLDDKLRVRYYKGYLASLVQAIK